ncbi:O-antigen ligase family protein [Thiobaca trueperi]|uniref:O-antigen ligase-like membrane protein n=1 Tax=Thiobaca trueperi TaxID=127458 RepID=A0A4R3MWP1_9GAMM|nr:O-antigen ligase family protein [Thiobaca trueperi]TCT18719.1 O-antigen ligase-like membrane protein [Thiobaca trueperi]
MFETSSTPHPRRSLLARGLSFWILVFILALSPLPFASVRPVWIHLSGILVAVALIAYLVQRWQTGRAIPSIPWPLRIAGALVALVALWGYVQAMPGWLTAWHHPIWSETATLLNAPDLIGSLSLTPERSILNANLLLTYLGFGLLVVWHSRRQRNLDLLLKIFVGAQAVYALYGLSVYFSDLETILWFDKTAYRDVLTSTFVNRNSYATYAGLGALAALVLILRFLRQTLTADKSHRTRIREFVETLTSTGWLTPVALLICLLAVLLTQSRMGLTALLIAGTVLLIGWTMRLPAGQTRRLGSILLSLLVVLLVVNFVLSGGLTADRFARLFEQGDGRFTVYPLMLDAIAERPLTGYGLGSFESAFRLVRDDTVMGFFDRGHSDYLELIMTIGWPAALALMLAFLVPLLAAWNMSRRRTEIEPALLSVAATVQIAVHSTVDFSMQMPAVVFAYLLLALAAFGTWHDSASLPAETDQRPPDAGIAPA